MRIRRIIWAALALYAFILVLTWGGGHVFVECRSRTLLAQAPRHFATRLEENIDSALWYASQYVFTRLGDITARPHTQEEMQRIADESNIDEVNVVSSNGLVIASNEDDVLGYDFHNNTNCLMFLELVNPRSKIYKCVQSFRPNAADPTDYRMYHCDAYEDRSGFIQLGYSMGRLIQVMPYTDTDGFKNWRVGRYGHFMALDCDDDRKPDAVSTWTGEPLTDKGHFRRVTDNGEAAFQLVFPFAGRLFGAVVPYREFGNRRTMVFWSIAGSSGLLILFFAIALIRVEHATAKVAALHRAADERAAADLAIARTIQMASLPRADLFAQEELAFSFSAVMHPAREVGGDFYDFFRIPGGRVAFLVADVSGKGIPGAMFMNVAKAAFRHAILAESDLATAVGNVNQQLCAENEAEMFVTAWFGLLDVPTGQVEYVNAGHNRPFLLQKDGTVIRLNERGGRFIGMFEEAAYRATRRLLAPGDRLVLYTDGVTEAMNTLSKPYGEARFVALLKTQPPAVIPAVEQDVAAFVSGAETSDDLTLLVLDWQGEPAPCTQQFPVTEDALGAVVAFLQQEVRLADRKQKMRLINAVDELAANVVAYSGAQKFCVAIENVTNRCRVTITDDGTAYNPLSHIDPQTHVPLEKRPIGGLGILMTKRLVSHVSYHREDDQNEVVLIQRCTG